MGGFMVYSQDWLTSACDEILIKKFEESWKKIWENFKFEEIFGEFWNNLIDI